MRDSKLRIRLLFLQFPTVDNYEYVIADRCSNNENLGNYTNSNDGGDQREVCLL